MSIVIGVDEIANCVFIVPLRHIALTGFIILIKSPFLTGNDIGIAQVLFDPYVGNLG